MKLFHLSDLHIGKMLNGYSLRESQKNAFLQILKYAEEEKPDAILICGDIYDKWIDAYKGEVNIEEDFSGKLFARSVDYAGNVSDAKVYDGIHVDATLPVLTITPTDLSANWTNKDSITISASDAGSGIKDNKVSYTTTYAGTEAFADVILDNLWNFHCY